jgi:predicted RecA/RadA family phage recombinase
MATTPLTAFTGKAIYVSGTPDVIDYTPGADVAAGDVVVLGNRPYVAHQAIPANTLGSLAAGGCVYDLIKDGTSGPNITQGQEVFWITGSTLATNVAGTNPHFGPAVAAAGASVDRVRTLHAPVGIDVNEET